MAERIVSPGVFTRERDLSFLPQGVSQIGAAIIGPTLKGPAFLPTLVRNFQEYEEVFGSTDPRYYTPYSIEQYLRSAGSVTVIRVLDITGYEADYVGLKYSEASSPAVAAEGIISFAAEIATTAIDKTISIVDGDGASLTFTTAESEDFTNRKFALGTAIDMANSLEDAINDVNGHNGAIIVSNDNGGTLTLNALVPGTAGNVDISGILVDEVDLKVTVSGMAGGLAAGGGVVQSSYIAAILAPSLGGGGGTADLSGCTLDSAASSSAATITLSGSNWGALGIATSSVSFQIEDSGAGDYITNAFGASATAKTGPGGDTMPVYLYKNFEHQQSISHAGMVLSLVSGSLDFDKSYAKSETPAILSQKIGTADPYQLFKVKTRSHGEWVTDKYFIGISQIKPAKAGQAPEFYGTFSLGVYSAERGNNYGNLIESWDALNFDPTHQNFFARVIGDRYATIGDGSGGTINGKIYHHGDWPNRSKYVYIDPDSYTSISEGRFPKGVVPFGHVAVQVPLESNSASASLCPTASFVGVNADDEWVGQKVGGSYKSSQFYGIDLNSADTTISDDNKLYLSATNNFSVGGNVDFLLSNMTGSYGKSADDTTGITLTNSDIEQRKFLVPFQGGFNGDNPAEEKFTGKRIVPTNTQGFDCSSATSSGSVAYNRALAAISNPDEFDVNMIITPGIIHGLHSKVTNEAIAVCEERGDCFYIVDSSIKGDAITAVNSRIEALDTNYAATYYPWVKIVDRNTSLPVWVPPSVVLPGVIAYTDQVAHEWFAPAGLNRGGLTTVLEAETRLTHLERDSLYEERVNPIASFPGQGVVVWGQKTLQAKPSALDRVNVRRLLIKLKKFIASSSRYLLFEQNNSATRARFLNIVNPFLESVQQNSGLSAFKVVMDDSNNTPDVIDRNQLVGQIFIQPTRTAEFIVLDFVVLPTGAAFPS